MAKRTTRKITSLTPYTKERQALPKEAYTMHGLQDWHNAMFEKFGWMLLAKAKGMNDKIYSYKKSIVRLEEGIKHVMSEYESKNRKHDLKVLLMNVEYLHTCAMKML